MLSSLLFFNCIIIRPLIFNKIHPVLYFLNIINLYLTNYFYFNQFIKTYLIDVNKDVQLNKYNINITPLALAR